MTQILSIKSNRPQKAVDLTPTAVEKVAELIQSEDEAGLALRMAVRPGGCSGFSYEMYFDSQVDDADLVEEFGDVRVVVDPQSAEMIKGSTL
ncbi:MAG: iron-sulfur cluster assembly accessory protein, partial [Actinobacteria bacterium]|nr:iron-sulfur cluster assembly accessory protein [Actinomycetota bacterium]